MQFLFPNEILQLILSHLSSRDLFRLKRTNRQFRQVIKQIKFGQLSKVQLSFPNDHQQQFAHICKSANYLLFDYYLNIFKDNKSRDFWLPFLNISCTSGDYHIPNYLTKKYRGNQKLKKSKYWNNIFFYVCQGGNIKLVKKFMKLGANDWNLGLRGACRGGHIEIVKLMIEICCRCNGNNANDWKWRLYEVCCGGHIEIVKFMIEKLEQSSIVPGLPNSQNLANWNLGLYGACQGKHIEIVKLMISRGATQCNYCNKPISEH